MVSWFDNKGVELHQEQLKLSFKKKKTPHFSKLKKDNVCSQVSDLASKKKKRKKGQRMHETRQTQNYKLTRERYHGKAFTTLTI